MKKLLNVLDNIIIGCLLVGCLLLGIGLWMHTKQIGMLIKISGKQTEYIQNLQGRMFTLENRLAIADFGYADEDTSYLIPGRGIPDAYWQMYLFERIHDLPIGDSIPLKPIWEQAVKDYWEQESSISVDTCEIQK